MLGAARCSRCLRASRLNSAGRPLWQYCSRPLSIWRAVPVYRKGELRAGAAQRRRRGRRRAAPHQGRALEGSTGHASVLQLGHIVATDANDPASRDLLATVLILLKCVGCARNSDLCVLRDVNRHILRWPLIVLHGVTRAFEPLNLGSLDFHIIFLDDNLLKASPCRRRRLEELQQCRQG